MSLPDIKKKKSIFDLYNEDRDFKIGLPDIPQEVLQPVAQSTLPVIQQNTARGMSDYELRQNVRAANEEYHKQNPISYPARGENETNEQRISTIQDANSEIRDKHEHWARLDNEFAAEEIRRKEEKAAQKKQANITHGVGQYVGMGIWTPEEAVNMAKQRGVDVSPDFFVNYLPKIKNRSLPNVLTQDEYKMKKFSEQQAADNMAAGLPPDISPDIRAKIELDRAKANEANVMATKNSLPPVVSDLEKAQTAEIIKRTGQIGVEKPLPPVALAQGSTLVDPATGKVIATGQEKSIDTPKPSYEESLIIADLRSKLGREPLPSEILEAKNAVQLKPLPPTEITKLAALKNTEKELGELIKAYRTDYSGWFDNMMANMGTTAGWTSSDETEFRRKLLANTTDFMYAKGGRQLSDKEMTILKNTMPQLGMGDSAFKAALVGFYQQVGNIIANREQEYRDKGYKMENDNVAKSDPLGIR